MQELFELMGTDIRENAPEARLLEEPFGPGFGRQIVGGQIHHLKHPSQGPVVNQLTRVERRFAAEAFGVAHHVFPPGSHHRPSGLLELIQSGEGRLVGEIVLAGLHNLQTHGASLIRNRGGGY